MTKSKLERFADIETFTNVFQHAQTTEIVDPFEHKGHWHERIFKNNNPIVLELGCGKGEYTVGLARKFPNKNFIGSDLKGNRIWVGAKTAIEEKLTNVAFLRTRIENIQYAFAENEVSEIWITFPDPQPQKTRTRKRLTNERFLIKYQQILQKDGIVQLKTDNEPFFDYTLETVTELNYDILCYTNNLYGGATKSMNEIKIPIETREIKTFYEKLFSEKGFDICYLAFKFR
jgi:tRNA (guanine-N7-)-methyltransferase